ncbi:MAG TPA: 30S ribosomal protein S11, partial [Firmicutes bacterium]|nr:30S ribosomal protein S11 [Bacillota bacterium]
MAQQRRRGRRRERRTVDPVGIAHVKATFNNTIVTITDLQGNVVAWSSGGKIGYKGARKGTPFAAQLAAEDAAKEAMAMGMKKVEVRIK